MSAPAPSPAASTAVPAIELRGLGLAYQRHQVLRDVDLTIPAGGITALVGPSGCGKSSLLACCNRLIDLVPGAQVTGSVRVAGHNVRARGVDVRRLRRQVGTIFQRPNPFPSSIRANLELALREHRCGNRAERHARSEQALRDLGLWDEVADRLDAPATTLSGGQQQRLCIARALALRPAILLLDEPCSALDPLATETIERLLRRLAGSYTLVVVTHHLAQARRIADRVAVLWQRDGVGTCIESGPTAQVFAEPREPETQRYVAGTAG